MQIDQPTSPEIDLSEKQTIAWDYLEDKTTNEVLYGGGAGSGKSYLGCIWHIYRRMSYAGSRGMIGRAKLSNLEQSTLVTLFKVANIMGYKQGIHYNYNSQKHVISWINGSQTILKDLFQYPSDPDFISLGSTEYTDAFIDEATEITLKAYDIVQSRIRYNLDLYGIVPTILLTCNPSNGWLKERFVLKENKTVELKPHQMFIQSLVSENPDEAFKTLYIQQLDRLSTDYDKQRLLYGNWNAERSVENPFAYKFDEVKHVGTTPFYDYRKQLIISVDFNLIPFCVTFRHFWEDSEGAHYHVFDEAEIKQGSLPEMIDRIHGIYSASLPHAILTGDAMGNRGEISQRDNASLYIQLLRGLQMKESQLRVRNNPMHENSRVEVNYALTYLPDFKIHPKCTGLIRDYLNVQVDASGKIMKGNRNDLNQRADFLDTDRYAIHNLLEQWIHKHQKQNRIF